MLLDERQVLERARWSLAGQQNLLVRLWLLMMVWMVVVVVHLRWRLLELLLVVSVLVWLLLLLLSVREVLAVLAWEARVLARSFGLECTVQKLAADGMALHALDGALGVLTREVVDECKTLALAACVSADDGLCDLAKRHKQGVQLVVCHGERNVEDEDTVRRVLLALARCTRVASLGHRVLSDQVRGVGNLWNWAGKVPDENGRRLRRLDLEFGHGLVECMQRLSSRSRERVAWRCVARRWLRGR